MQDIADFHNCNTTKVIDFMKDHNIPRRSQSEATKNMWKWKNKRRNVMIGKLKAIKSQFSEEEIIKICNLRKKRFGLSAIAKELNTNATTVLGILRKYLKNYKKYNLISKGQSKKRKTFQGRVETLFNKISPTLNFKEEVLSLFRHARDLKLTLGHTIEAVLCACYYYIRKSKNYPVNFRFLAKQSNVSLHEITNIYSDLIQKLNLNCPQFDLIDLLKKYCKNLSLTRIIEKKSILLLSTYLKVHNVSGKNPKGYCAGVIYLICNSNGVKKSQKAIAITIGMSDITLRERRTEIALFYNKETFSFKDLLSFQACIDKIP